jgi:hypothetical protein
VTRGVNVIVASSVATNENIESSSEMRCLSFSAALDSASPSSVFKSSAVSSTCSMHSAQWSQSKQQVI